MLPFPPLERRSAPAPAPFMDGARAIDGQHAWLGCEARTAAKTPPRAPNAALAFLRCARYRVPARPRPRARRSAGPRGASRWDCVFFFARTAQPFGRVRTPGTDQTTRRRVSRRSTSNKRGTPDRRAVNIAESCCMWTTYRNTMHHAWRHRMCFGKVLERLRWKSKLSGRIRSPTTC